MPQEEPRPAEEATVIVRAKCLLMDKLNIPEQVAHKLLRRVSMDARKPLLDLAMAVVRSMNDDRPAG